MFTGLVEECGQVAALIPGVDSVELQVRGPKVTADAGIGDSICVNGVCLTVTKLDGEVFSAFVMAESLRRSNLGELEPGSPVNLERAMAANGRFGGHIVQGHVDGVGVLSSREPGDKWETIVIEVPANLRPFLVEKGSITVDGVSLTVAGVTPTGIEIGLIPQTLADTNLGTKPVGAKVNLEVDVLAKYVEQMLRTRFAVAETPAVTNDGTTTNDETK